MHCKYIISCLVLTCVLDCSTVGGGPPFRDRARARDPRSCAERHSRVEHTPRAEDALFAAAAAGDAKKIQKLLDAGVDPNARNKNGQTALHLAAASDGEDVRVIAALLKAGAQVDMLDNKGDTPLWGVVRKLRHVEDRDKIAVLLDAGADSSKIDAEGYAPVHFCMWGFLGAKFYPIEIIVLLVGGASNINVKDKERGMTPLHWACMGHDFEIIDALILAGADVSATDNDGNTPLAIAMKVYEGEMRLRVIQRLKDAASKAKEVGR